MKRTINFTLVFMLLLSPVFSKEKSFSEIKHTIALTELNSEMIKELLAGMHPDVAIECKAGSSLPVEFLYNVGFFSAKCTPSLSVKVEKPCYLRCIKHKVYISQDLANWEKPRDFFNGKEECSVKMSDDKSILVETNLIQ